MLSQEGCPRPHLWLVEQGSIEELQLGAQRLVVADGVGRGAIDDMHERARSLAVAQELMAQAHARVRALQQPCDYIGVRGSNNINGNLPDLKASDDLQVWHTY